MGSFSVTKTKIKVFSLLFLILLSISFFQPLSEVYAENGLTAGTQARVSGTDGDGVRMRSQPSSDASTMNMLNESWLVTIKGGPYKDNNGNSFYKIEWAGQTGYIMTQYVSRASSGGISLGSQIRIAGTDGEGVRLRSQPNVSAAAIATLGENWLATVQGGPFKDNQGNSFYKVEWTGKIGYVSADYVSFAGGSSTTASTGVNSKLTIGGQAKVNGTGGEGVNLRQQPNVVAPTLSVLGETYLVTVLGGPFSDKEGNSYYRVEWAGYTGFVSGSFLTTAPKNAVAGTGGNMRVTNTDGDQIRFRTGAGKQYPENGYVYEGQVLKILAGPTKDANGTSWYKLDRNGEVGYVDAVFLQRTSTAVTNVTVVKAAAPSAPAVPRPIPAPASNGPLGQRIADYARQFVGYRYVWAGDNPAVGFDCSGFVYWVMKEVAGVNVGHSVSISMGSGTPVPREALQPGDYLIFYNTYNSGPSHSAIYLGNGQFVHAESEGSGVTIDNLNDAYWSSHYNSARRIGV
jgi:cell wall-associated NlpC family hydrolase